MSQIHLHLKNYLHPAVKIVSFRKWVYLFIILLILGNRVAAVEYILFDEDRINRPAEVNPFSLYYNVSEIGHKTIPDLSWNIYNLYFTRHNFELRSVYTPGLPAVYADPTLFDNDIVITITPLYLRNTERKLVEIRDKKALDTLKFINEKELLKRAVRNIYAVDFAAQEKRVPDSLDKSMTGRIKSLDYKLVIKRNGKYYLCLNEVLTEFYYVHSSGFLFPDEAGFCGIYEPWPSQVYTPDFIRKVLPEQLKMGSLGSVYANAVSGKLFCGGYDTLSAPGLSLVNYWTNMPNVSTASGRLKYYFRSRQLRPYNIRNGINNFQLLRKVGIINGNFEFFLYEPMRNRQTDAPPDTDVINFHFSIKAINNKPLNEFIAWYLKEYPPRIIPVE